MKTSRRVIALILALVMSVGFMATVSAADYTYQDQDKIGEAYVDAVAQMKDLGIMGGSSPTGGTDDWTFRPQDTLTRAEVCKIMYVLYTTIDNASAFKDMAGFTDVKAADWFAGYVNWAKSKEIVSGSNAAGTAFSPYGKVTLAQACKMFLVAAGYSATTEAMVGTGWDGRVMSLALQSGLMDGLQNISNAAELTREQLAQLCSNTLAAYSVQYNSDNGIAYETEKTVLTKYFRFLEFEASVVANPTLSIEGRDVTDKGKTLVVGLSTSNYPGLEITLPVDLGTDYVGRIVKFIVKGTEKTTTSGGTTSVTGVTVNSIYSRSFADTTFSVTADDVKIAAGASIFTYDSNAYKSADASSVPTTSNNIVQLDYDTAMFSTAPVSATTLNGVFTSLKAETPVLLVCKDKKIIRMMVKNYTFVKIDVNASGKVSAKGAGDNTYAWSGYISKDDIIVGKDLAVKDNYVLAYKIGSDKYGLETPTVLTAKMSSVKGTGQDTYVINNKDYTVSALNGIEAKDEDIRGLRGTEAKYYILGSKILKAVGTSTTSSSSSYCVVTASDWSGVGSSKKAYVDVLLDTGVSYSDLVVKEGTQAAFETTTTYPGGTAKGKLYKYSLSTDKKTITLTALTASTGIGHLTTGNITNVSQNISATIVGAGTVSVTDDSVTFIRNPNTDKFYAYKGAKLPLLTETSTSGVYGALKEGLFTLSGPTGSAVPDDVIVMALEGVPTTTSDSISVRGLLIGTELLEDFADANKEMIMFTLRVNDNEDPAVFYVREIDGTAVGLSDLATLTKNHAMLLINEYKTETLNGTSYNVITEFETIAPASWLAATTADNEGVYGGYITRVTSSSLTLKVSNGSSLGLTFASGVEVYFVNGDDEVTKGTVSDIRAFGSTTMPTGKWNAVVSLNAEKKIVKIFIYEGDELWD